MEPSQAPANTETDSAPPLVRHAGMVLPLPAVLAYSLPWQIDRSEGQEPIPLWRLAEREPIERLERVDRLACASALATALKLLLQHGTLPAQVLRWPVDAAVAPQVREFLAKRGWLLPWQPLQLGVEHALGFIGIDPARLLACIGSDAPAPGAAPAWNQPLRSIARLGMMHQSPRSTHRTGTEDAQTWGVLRAQQPAVGVRLDDGTLVTAQDPRLGKLLADLHAEVGLEAGALSALAEQVREQRRAAALIEQLQQAIERVRGYTVQMELRDLNAKVFEHVAHSRRRQLTAAYFGMDGPAQDLAQIGERQALTQQYMQETLQLFGQRLRSGTVYTPALERLRQALDATGLLPVQEFEQQHRGLLGTQSLVGALRFLQQLERHPGGELVDGAALGSSGLWWSGQLSAAAAAAVMAHERAMRALEPQVGLWALAGLATEASGRAVTSAQVKALLDSGVPALQRLAQQAPGQQPEAAVIVLRQPQSELPIEDRVFALPKAQRERLAGSYTSPTSGRTIRVNNRQIFKLAEELAAAGVQPGEPFELTLDPSTRSYAWRRY